MLENRPSVEAPIRESTAIARAAASMSYAICPRTPASMRPAAVSCSIASASFTSTGPRRSRGAVQELHEDAAETGNNETTEPRPIADAND